MDSTAPQGATADAWAGTGNRRGLVLVGILLTILLAGIDGTVVGTVMPATVSDLGGAALYPWAFAAYMLATAATMPVWGPGSDRWGRRRTYLAGVGVFLVGSLLCALAPNMLLFVAARAVQGAGAGAIFSLPFIVLGVIYPPDRRARALGIVASAWALASVAGPPLGTAALTAAGWRWVFLFNLPVGALALLLVGRGLGESVGDRVGSFDASGSILAGVGGAALIGAFVRLGEGQVGALEATLVAVGVALFALFVMNERKAASPVLPLDFFRRRGFSAATGASFLSTFVAFGLFAFLPLQVDNLFHDAKAVGLVVSVFAASWSGAALTSGRVVHRFGERAFVVAGMILLGAGLLLLAPAVATGDLFTIAAVSAIPGLGMGTMTPALTVSVQNAVEVAHMGSATASQQFLRQLGAALGVGSFGLAFRLGDFATGTHLLVAGAAVGLAAALFLPRTSLTVGHREETAAPRR